MLYKLITDCRVLKSSGCHRYEYWGEQFLFDGRYDTGWCTPSRTTPQVEFLEIEFLNNVSISRIRLLSRAINRDAGFPVDFCLKAYNDDTGKWEPFFNAFNIINFENTWHEWEFNSITLKKIRMEIERVGWREEGKYFLQFMALEFYQLVKVLDKLDFEKVS